MDFKIWLVRDAVTFSIKAFFDNISLYFRSLLLYLVGLIITGLLATPIVLLLYFPVWVMYDKLPSGQWMTMRIIFTEIMRNPLFVLIFVFTLLVQVTIVAVVRSGYIRMLLRLHDTGVSSAREVFEEFKIIFNFKFAVLSFIYVFCVCLGFMILIVPGIYLAARWSLAYYIFVDRRTGVIEALKESWRLTKGYEWPLIILLLVFYVMSFNTIIWFLMLFITDLMFIYSYRVIVAKHTTLAPQPQ